MSVELYLAKSNGLIEAISLMSPDERKRQASYEFGLDYNGLVANLKEAVPSLAPVLPPQANIGQNVHNSMACFTPYGEILAWCCQIRELLAIVD